MLLLLFGCRTAEPPLSPEPADSAAPEPAWACAPISAPQAGYDTEEPALADRHAPTFGDAAEPFHTHLSWTDDPSTTVTMVWRTDADTLASQVQFGLDQTYGTIVDGASFFIGADATHGRAHEVRLCGLEPATTYHYRVGGEGHWSEDRTFTTAPARGESAPFRFAVVGDTRGAPDTFALILDLVEEKAPDFYLFTGDAVGLGSNMTEWGLWFDAGAGHFDRRPLVFAHGNHEFQTRNYYALFAQPGNEQWFSVDYADAHFAVLNDTVATSGDKEVQASWLEDDLAASDARWKFTVHHMSAYSSCVTHGSELTLRDLWSPVAEAAGVAVDFAGHNHNYERSVPLRSGVETTAELGTTYVVAAGGGAPLYNNEMAEAFTAVAAVTQHYVIVDVADGTLSLTAYDLAGNVLDTFTTTR